MQITINTETGEFAELLRILCEYRVPTPGPNVTPDEDPEEVPEPRPEPLIHAELTKLDAMCRDVGFETRMSVNLDGNFILSVNTHAPNQYLKFIEAEDGYIYQSPNGFCHKNAVQAFRELIISETRATFE